MPAICPLEVVVALEFKPESSCCVSGDVDHLPAGLCVRCGDEDSPVSGSCAVSEDG